MVKEQSGALSLSLAYGKCTPALLPLLPPFPLTASQAHPTLKKCVTQFGPIQPVKESQFTKTPSLNPQPLTDLFPGLMQLWSILW